MKTPPEKQEHRLMAVSHQALEARSLFCRSREKSFSGNIPQRNVITTMANRVIIFSVYKVSPAMVGVLKVSKDKVTTLP